MSGQNKNENKNVNIVLECPHCKEHVLIEQLNCCIFRHGIYVGSGKQIDPHLPKDQCVLLAKTKLIYGCGKPFKIVKKEGLENEYIAEECDYI